MRGKFVYKLNSYSYYNKGFGKVLNRLADSLEEVIETLNNKKFKIKSSKKKNK